MLMKNLKNLFLILVVLFSALTSCTDKCANEGEWKRSGRGLDTNMVMYQADLRNFGEDGTSLSAFGDYTTKLANLGIDMVYMLPLQPVYEKWRGDISRDAVRNFEKIDSIFGKPGDLKKMIDKAHENDIKVFMEWNAAYSAIDHPWINEQNDWYLQNTEDAFFGPEGRDDVALFNYGSESLREQIVVSLEMWIAEYGLDGFIVRGAEAADTDFWNEVKCHLLDYGAVNLLGDAQGSDYYDYAFDARWNPEFYLVLSEMNQSGTFRIDEGMFNFNDSQVPLINFVTNFRINKESGSLYDQFANRTKISEALMFLSPGIPLVYNGREADVDKRIGQVSSKTVEWNPNQVFSDLYSKMISLRKRNDLLALNTEQQMHTLASDSMLVVQRGDDNQIIAFFNLTDVPVQFRLPEDFPQGDYINVFSRVSEEVFPGRKYQFYPYEFRVFEKD